MKKTTFIATLPNGETIKRTTHRTYTHAVVAEFRYTDGEVEFGQPRWAGRPELAQKYATRLKNITASIIGERCKEFRYAPNGLAEYCDLGYGYEDIRVHAIPVNA